ncbi:MAG: hypothetical protein VKJ24_16585 [Synechococcales bacterium]|nr:hypothetical protein [Synechococcales bacterium]
MLLNRPNIKHLNTLAHEGKLLMVATISEGNSSKLYYTIKQDGFEDSALQNPNGSGWEPFQPLELPNESSADQSVVDQERNELTYKTHLTSFRWLIVSPSSG